MLFIEIQTSGCHATGVVNPARDDYDPMRAMAAAMSFDLVGGCAPATLSD